jgi:cation diffusion facilitator CzcD-associated flavoprotein CzcO
MMKVENIIVGAGPYGLSIASHLRENNIEALVIGQPMASWRGHMPTGMILKSETFASSLSDPSSRYNFERFFRLRGTAYRPIGDPLSLADFIDYADWFRQQAVPEVRDVELVSLRRVTDGFELGLGDGSRLWAKRVILATGYLAFRQTPQFLDNFPAELATHTSQHRDLSRFAGKDVTVIGRGQSGLETAALLHERGANVRLLVRAANVEWNSDPNAVRSPIARLRRPDAGLGAGWYSLAISELPKVFFRLPLHKRDRIVRTSWGPSGAWWLKQRVVEKFPVLTSHELSHVVERNGKLELSVQTAGATVRFETDHIIAATGYKVDLKRLPFLDKTLQSEIKAFDGSPRLNAAFESSVTGLHFVGVASAQSFGPVMRFVYGAKHAAAILTRHVRRASHVRPSRIPTGDTVAVGTSDIAKVSRW